MIPLYGAAPGLLSSKGSRFLFIAANHSAHSLGPYVDICERKLCRNLF